MIVSSLETSTHATIDSITKQPLAKVVRVRCARTAAVFYCVYNTLHGQRYVASVEAHLSTDPHYTSGHKRVVLRQALCDGVENRLVARQPQQQGALDLRQQSSRLALCLRIHDAP